MRTVQYLLTIIVIILMMEFLPRVTWGESSFSDYLHLFMVYGLFSAACNSYFKEWKEERKKKKDGENNA